MACSGIFLPQSPHSPVWTTFHGSNIIPTKGLRGASRVHYSRGEDVLPASAVHSLGPDAVVSRSDELIDGREWRDRELVKRGEATAMPATRER